MFLTLLFRIQHFILSQLFDSITETRRCSEVILEIIKYLTLNDAIKAFSNKILSLLHINETKLQLSDPSHQFTNIILQKIKSEQIVSLRLNAMLIWAASELAPLVVLQDVISLTLLNCHRINSINEYEDYFPNLIRLSLWYDYEINFSTLSTILKQLQRPIK